MGTRAASDYTIVKLFTSLTLPVCLLGIILLLVLSPQSIYYSCRNQPKGISGT